VNAPVLGRFGTAVRVHHHLLLPQDGPFKPAPAFDPNVWLLPLFPGLSPDGVRAIAEKASGLVLAGFGAGNIPSGSDAARRGNGLEDVIRECAERTQPVVVTTRCVVGQAEGGYATGHAARRAGAIIANDLTPECAFVKLAWVLGNLANPDVLPRDAQRAGRGGPGRLGMVRKAMLTPLAGEITDNATMEAVNRRRLAD
jgi:L-asparaginase/Glu-tRNA(Gln) amidotransferase subunit D